MMFRTGLSLAFALGLCLVAGCADSDTDRLGERGPGERAPADPETRPGPGDPTTTPRTNADSEPLDSDRPSDGDPTPNTNESPNGGGTRPGAGGTNPGGANTQNR